MSQFINNVFYSDTVYEDSIMSYPYIEKKIHITTSGKMTTSVSL